MNHDIKRRNNDYNALIELEMIIMEHGLNCVRIQKWKIMNINKIKNELVKIPNGFIKISKKYIFNGELDILRKLLLNSMDEDGNSKEIEIFKKVLINFWFTEKYIIISGTKEDFNLLLSQLSLLYKDNFELIDTLISFDHFFNYCRKKKCKIIFSQIQISEIEFENCNAKINLSVNDNIIGEQLFLKYDKKFYGFIGKIEYQDQIFSLKINRQGFIQLYSPNMFFFEFINDFLKEETK